MAGTMDPSYAFHQHSRSMASLASTILPVHSDASAFTSVNTSPLEPLDYLDPSMELKVPLPDLDTPVQTDLEKTDLEGPDHANLPDAALAEGQEPGLADHGTIRDITRDTEDQRHQDGDEPEREEAAAERSSNVRQEQAVQEDGEVHPISLNQVRDLLRRRQYHRNHASSLQRALDSQTLVCGLNRRLIPSLGTAYRIMANCYQSSDVTGFVEVYQAAEGLVEACGAQPPEHMTTKTLDPCPSEKGNLHSLSWLARLPQGCQDYVLDLISKLRTDENFLASRLSALSFLEFSEVFAHAQILRKPQSMFQMHFQRGSGDRGLQYPSPGRPPILDQIRSFHQGDPFFVLSHGIFDSSSGVGTREYLLRVRVWSTACARVINEGKPGSDDFTTAVLNAFSDSSAWALKPQLDKYIAKVLHDGAFLLDSAPREPKPKEPVEIYNANAAIAQSKFFDKALKDLLSILLDASSVSMLPEGLIGLIRLLMSQISSTEVRHRARNFIAWKWFIQSLVCRILTFPEHYGVMMHEYIASNARTAILEEIASRLQKQVFDSIYSWYMHVNVPQPFGTNHLIRKSTAPTLDPEMNSMMRKLLDRFDASDSQSDLGTSTASDDSTVGKGPLMLSAHDLAGLLRTLFPHLSRATSPDNPSTAGSSTLVPDIFQWGKGDRSSTTTLSRTSSAGAKDTKSGYLSSLSLKSGTNYSGVNSVAETGICHPESSDQELIQTYRCLTLNLPWLPTSMSELSNTEWAFLETNANGEVFIRAMQTGFLGESDPVHDGNILAVEAGQQSTRDLQCAITRLLTQEDECIGGLDQFSLTERHVAKDVLEQLVKAAVDRATLTSNYLELHFWWQMQNTLHTFDGPIDSILRSISDACRQSIGFDQEFAANIQHRLFLISSLLQKQGLALGYERRQRKTLRLKMWYTSDVRHSSTFEDAVHVTQALRAMANTSRSKQTSGVAHWARSRLRNVKGHDRSTAQTLEALTEPNHHSGTSKLNDEQVERTTSWLTRNSVENFCRGEERIHRFCLEIRKCIHKLTGSTLLESPVLWSSRLFEPEKRIFHRKPQANYHQPTPNMNGNLPGSPSSHPPAYPAITSFPPTAELSPRWEPSSQFADAAILGISSNPARLDDFAPKEPIRSLPYRTSHIPIEPSDIASFSLPTAYGSRQGFSRKTLDGRREEFLAEIRSGFCSLILSDLSYLLWPAGSETDVWITQSSLEEPRTLQEHGGRVVATAAKQRAEPSRPRNARRDLRSLLMAATAAQQDSRSTWHVNQTDTQRMSKAGSKDKNDQATIQRFPYRATYKSILERFSLSHDPHTKLRMLQELEALASQSIQESMIPAKDNSRRSRMGNVMSLKRFNSRSLSVPRTKATSFEEVIANCTERRAGTLKFTKSIRALSAPPADNESFGTDEIVNALLTIFRDPDLRPRTLFRDLQFIAALVPAEILDQTLQGKAFWDAGLAALALKQELCDAMIVRATDITTYHITLSASTSPHPPPPPTPLRSSNNYHDLIHTDLADAAPLWIIAAKEGSATAARELGLLYLTHPILLPRTTMQPFSKPKEVFKAVGGAGKEGVGAKERKEGRLDPVTFAVVFHWMEVAANGGDRDARDFLRGNGEWGKR
ncbi:MAG: hypothetical protein Q9212_004714 [Teloschistes hypoglaucus]